VYAGEVRQKVCPDFNRRAILAKREDDHRRALQAREKMSEDRAGVTGGGQRFVLETPPPMRTYKREDDKDAGGIAGEVRRQLFVPDPSPGAVLQARAA
jgi:hypothetical protein